MSFLLTFTDTDTMAFFSGLVLPGVSLLVVTNFSKTETCSSETKLINVAPADISIFNYELFG